MPLSSWFVVAPTKVGGRRTGAARAVCVPAILRAAVLGLVGTIALVAGPSPAEGHAGGGQLPQAHWEPAEGRQVVGRWVAPADDAALIGSIVGVLQEGAMEAFLGGPSDDYPTEEEVAALGGSAELKQYLLDNVQVRQEGQRCDAEVEIGEDFLVEGARFRFTCPDVIEMADIRITVLHDQDPAYRTFSGDGTLQDALHTSEQPEHRWDFTSSSQDGQASGTTADASQRASAVPVSLFVGAALLIAVAIGSIWIVSTRTRGARR